MAYLYACPYCGHLTDSFMDFCPHCRNKMTPLKSRYEEDYYLKKSNEKYGKSHGKNHWWADEEFILKEVKENPLFDEMLYNSVIDNYKTSNNVLSKKNITVNIPKCPTCGSTNISKIGSLKRAAHGYAFGLFSKTARSQFECKNCGYKW